MTIIDASGPIHDNMWSYGPPFTKFKLIELKNPEWVDFSAYSQAFEGFCMTTGTYINGPAHAIGLTNSYPLHKIPVEKLFGIDAYVLKFNLDKLGKEGKRPYITFNDIKEAEMEIIPEGSSIIIATGWGKHWDSDDFLTHNWFLKKDAVEYLVSKKPFVLAGDTPAYDNVDNQQGLWKIIYGNDVLVVAPLVNIEKVKKFKVKLFVCPLNIINTTGLPCRVIIQE